MEYEDSLYTELWARDYACALFNNAKAWLDLYAETEGSYSQKSADWTGEFQKSGEDLRNQILAQEQARKDQMDSDHIKQTETMNAFMNAFMNALDLEETKREEELKQRSDDVSRYILWGQLRLEILGNSFDFSEGAMLGRVLSQANTVQSGSKKKTVQSGSKKNVQANTVQAK